MDKLMEEFQKFWRRHSDIWESKSEYTEAFPHLLLMAFLQRVLNGGGRIEREYAAGRGRMDLGIEYNGHLYVVEIKLVHYYETPQIVREEGLEQIRSYRDKFAPGAPSYLVIFDRRPEARQKPWDERIFWEPDGDVIIVGC
jgi:ASC-1-like (ASCH) protein